MPNLERSERFWDWQFNWQTLKGWAKTCREAVLTLKDGSQHMAQFNFVK